MGSLREVPMDALGVSARLVSLKSITKKKKRSCKPNVVVDKNTKYKKKINREKEGENDKNRRFTLTNSDLLLFCRYPHNWLFSLR